MSHLINDNFLLNIQEPIIFYLAQIRHKLINMKLEPEKHENELKDYEETDKFIVKYDVQ
jgi:hypothetical protein